MVGAHLVRSWSQTQAAVCLPSGEAELVGTAKATAEIIGIRNLCSDFGTHISCKGPVYTDAQGHWASPAGKGWGTFGIWTRASFGSWRSTAA